MNNDRIKRNYKENRWKKTRELKDKKEKFTKKSVKSLLFYLNQ